MYPIQIFEELTSTNDYMKVRGDEMCNHQVILAKHQSAGRGRFTRSWKSEKDATFSILFREVALSHTLLAPLAVVYACEYLRVPVSIKWPNDILYQGKKAAGILVETVYEGNSRLFDVVGIGINMKQEFQPDLINKAICLPLDIPAEEMLYQVIRAYQMLMRMDDESILKEYRRYSMLIGKSISLRDGLYDVVNISAKGELMLAKDGKHKVLRSEEISLSQIYEGKSA